MSVHLLPTRLVIHASHTGAVRGVHGTQREEPSAKTIDGNLGKTHSGFFSQLSTLGDRVCFSLPVIYLKKCYLSFLRKLVCRCITVLFAKTRPFHLVWLRLHGRAPWPFSRASLFWTARAGVRPGLSCCPLWAQCDSLCTHVGDPREARCPQPDPARPRGQPLLVPQRPQGLCPQRCPPADPSQKLSLICSGSVSLLSVCTHVHPVRVS